MVLLTAPSLVHAHTGAGHTTGFAHGFAHPLGGLDHMLAMAAVGIWASQAGGRALWALPAAFVSMMTLGSVLGMAGVTAPFIEEGILLSVLVLGLLVAAAARLQIAASIVITGLFAAFHGHAHGAEIPGAASGLEYGVGFVLATCFLHLSGAGAGLLFRRLDQARLVRYAGGAIAAGGAYLFLA
jgi:urease accessory protein